MRPKSGHRFPACAKARHRFVVSFDASAGEGRSENIMLKQKINAKAHSILSFRVRCGPLRAKKSPPQQAGFFKSLRPDAYMLHPDAGHST
jgi:hypothetical protein